MPIYFFVLDSRFFHEQAAPALGRSWRERSFAPCRALCDLLKPAATAFSERFHTSGEDPILSQIDGGLPFDRDIWRLLAGEVLLFGALEVPEIVTAPDTLACLLDPARLSGQALTHGARLNSSIHQVHYGTRDLVFGSAFYRPDEAGLNDVDDVSRLARYLEDVEPQCWSVADLRTLRGVASDEDRQDELEVVRDWFPLLRQLYCRAREEKHLIICEMLGSQGEPGA